MAGLVTTLRTGVPLDAADHFAGPWRELRVDELTAGRDLTLTAADHEAVVYIVAGDGAATVGDEQLPLEPGVALTLGRGSSVTLTTDRRVRFFLALLDLDGKRDD